MLEAIVLVLHVYSCLLQEKNTFQCYKWRRPQNLYGFQMWDVHSGDEIIGRSKDVHKMSVKCDF